MRALMSFTTLRRSRPLVLAETTILRFTFSRLMVFGVYEERMSATCESGIMRPLALLMVMSLMRSAVVRVSSSALTTRLNILSPS